MTEREQLEMARENVRVRELNAQGRIDWRCDVQLASNTDGVWITPMSDAPLHEMVYRLRPGAMVRTVGPDTPENCREWTDDEMKAHAGCLLIQDDEITPAEAYSVEMGVWCMNDATADVLLSQRRWRWPGEPLTVRRVCGVRVT